MTRNGPNTRASKSDAGSDSAAGSCICCVKLFVSHASKTQTPRPSDFASRSESSASFASARGTTVVEKRCGRAPSRRDRPARSRRGRRPFAPSERATRKPPCAPRPGSPARLRRAEPSCPSPRRPRRRRGRRRPRRGAAPSSASAASGRARPAPRRTGARRSGGATRATSTRRTAASRNAAVGTPITQAVNKPRSGLSASGRERPPRPRRAPPRSPACTRP